MIIASSGILMDALRQHDLLTTRQLTELPHLAPERRGDVRPLAKALIQKGWLTVYQVNQLLAGNGRELAIGPYHVIDKLGQGGLSTVYQARHREHKSLVAIKIIKPEVFASAEGRAQFLQEVEAMARLDHANIVQFCDADQWQDTYYFAMEYIEGTDLGKVVRLSGALPIHEACDYIRQAAMGLQHAYERNLVHRDIKPVNLFLTLTPSVPGKTGLRQVAMSNATMLMKPLIKILDWGLASTRTPKGTVNQRPLDNVGKSVVGTADYLSPEQACNANTVDIRGDIYSLGCSLYYLLTGQAPFPDGTLMHKIMQHQQAEPRPLDSFRGDVPAPVAAILKRMMAKTPADRFQTPASAALALMPFTRRTALLPMMSSNVPTASRTRDDTPIPPPLAGVNVHVYRSDDTSGPQ